MDNCKIISVVVPTFNESENVVPLSDAIVKEFNKIPKYDYEIIFIDNKSSDDTSDYYALKDLLIRNFCILNSH